MFEDSDLFHAMSVSPVSFQTDVATAGKVWEVIKAVIKEHVVTGKGVNLAPLGRGL